MGSTLEAPRLICSRVEATFTPLCAALSAFLPVSTGGNPVPEQDGIVQRKEAEAVRKRRSSCIFPNFQLYQDPSRDFIEFEAIVQLLAASRCS